MAIPYDRGSLETYQQKLFDLIQVVPGYWRGARPVLADRRPQRGVVWAARFGK